MHTLGANIKDLCDRFKRTVGSIEDGSFQEKIKNAVGSLLHRCAKAVTDPSANPSNPPQQQQQLEASSINRGASNHSNHPHPPGAFDSIANALQNDSLQVAAAAMAGEDLGSAPGPFLKSFGREWRGPQPAAP